MAFDQTLAAMSCELNLVLDHVSLLKSSLLNKLCMETRPEHTPQLCYCSSLWLPH